MNKASREKSSEDTKKGKSTSFYNQLFTVDMQEIS
jgi:hypothetical protein